MVANLRHSIMVVLPSILNGIKKTKKISLNKNNLLTTAVLANDQSDWKKKFYHLSVLVLGSVATDSLNCHFIDARHFGK